MAIIGMHAILYSKKAEETRKFFSDVLGWPSVDAGRGWLIFETPPAELAVHPAEDEEQHELYLMCDDLDGTIAELKAKKVETTEVHEQPWGRLTHIVLPSGQRLGLYQPKHPMAIAGARK
jgi:predicted enzyme related to lactoylglutathione lyase